MVATRRQALAGRGLGTRTIGFTALAAFAPISWGTAYLVTAEFLPPDRPLLAGLLSALPTGLAALL
jgi:probable blue pigment (indigoidine) exporter